VRRSSRDGFITWYQKVNFLFHLFFALNAAFLPNYPPIATNTAYPAFL
jgi:hypothetical protein